MLKESTITSSSQPRLLNVQQAAQYLACTVAAVRQLQWSRAVPFLKIGKRILFDRTDLDRYIDFAKESPR